MQCLAIYWTFELGSEQRESVGQFAGICSDSKKEVGMCLCVCVCVCVCARVHVCV